MGSIFSTSMVSKINDAVENESLVCAFGTSQGLRDTYTVIFYTERIFPLTFFFRAKNAFVFTLKNGTLAVPGSQVVTVGFLY